MYNNPFLCKKGNFQIVQKFVGIKQCKRQVVPLWVALLLIVKTQLLEQTHVIIITVV